MTMHSGDAGGIVDPSTVEGLSAEAAVRRLAADGPKRHGADNFEVQGASANQE